MRNFHLTIGGKRYAVSAEREEGTGRLRIVLDGQAYYAEVEEAEGAALPASPPSASPPPAAPRPAA
ncbi:MAG: hypothetical protein AABZ64_11820, partial [Nitrospinota bacterium]